MGGARGAEGRLTASPGGPSWSAATQDAPATTTSVIGRFGWVPTGVSGIVSDSALTTTLDAETARHVMPAATWASALFRLAEWGQQAWECDAAALSEIGVAIPWEQSNAQGRPSLQTHETCERVSDSARAIAATATGSLR